LFGCLGDQWWALRLEDTKWPRGRTEAYEKIASGEAAAGEFFMYPRPAYEACIPNRPGRDLRPYEIECKTVAWLPRQRPERLTTLQTRACRPDTRAPSKKPKDFLFRAGPGPPDARILNQSIEEADVRNVRRAICANWISFPSQVPTFAGCGPPDLQHKLIQLYFVMGWSCAKIAARYGLLEGRVRGVLDVWKWRAANAGYLQHIPSAEVITTPSQITTKRVVQKGKLWQPLPAQHSLF
jgi:hypothetical protein